MKRTLFFLVLTVFVITACGTPSTPVPAPTNTHIPLPTETAIPTATLEPSPTPMPIGGGGKFIMQVAPLLVPKEFNSQESASWFSASSDGTNLELLNWQIWSISPDGKRALTYTSDRKIALTNLDGTTSISLDDSLDYYINSNFQTAIWLPNGNIALLAFDKSQSAKILVFLVSPDGKLTKWEKASQIMQEYAELLFLSPNRDELYLKTMCGNNRCNTRYYVISLDDSEQKQILENVNRLQDLYISPSGQYIAYVDTSKNIMNCSIYKIADETTTIITPDDGTSGLDYCFGENHWSPTEDILFGQTKDGISIWEAQNGNIRNVATFLELNAGACYSTNWTPDGKFLFLSVCTETYSDYKELRMQKLLGKQDTTLPFTKSSGQRLINISDGKVIEYPDAGFCESILSPDSKWALLYLCTNEKNVAIYPSQLLNLDTKEMYPVFQGFVSNSPDTLVQPEGFYQKDWSVFWIP